MDAVALGDLINDAVTLARTLATTAQVLSSPFTSRRKRQETRSETLELVSTLQERVLAIQAVALGLQDENGKLRQQIRDSEVRAAERKQYRPTQVGAATVLTSADTPGIYYCPACYEVNRQTVPLQPHFARSFGSHRCPVCQQPYRLTG